MEFRDAVKYLRTELSLTQMELANALHINFATVGRWENGKNLPTRAITAALLEFARARGVSDRCMEHLKQAAVNATKVRLSQRCDSLYPVEHSTLSQLIDDASYPIYVCDIQTDEILYLNQKACEMVGDEGSVVGKPCYTCLMHRSTPCAFCHKQDLLEDRFTSFDALRPFDGTTYKMQGKRILWNGRQAHVRFITQTDSGRQLRGIVDHMNGGVYVVVYADNGEVRLTYANEKYYTLFGYTKAQFHAELKDPNDLLFPEDAAGALAAVEEVKSTGRPSTFRYRIIKKDGSIAHIRCSSSLSSIPDLGNRVLISVLTDITASIEAERQTLVLGQRLDAIMKNISNAVTAVVLHEGGAVSFLFSNELYYEMLGYTKEQYQSEVTDPFRLVAPEDVSAVRSAVLGTARVGDTKVLQYRVICRDGRIKWFRARLSVLSFPDQAQPVQLAVYADVTDMVEANNRLAAQRDHIRDMVNLAPSGIAVIQVDPSNILGSQKALFYNDRFFSFSGYDQQEYEALLSRDQFYFAYKEDVPALCAFVAQVCRGEIGHTQDIPLRCRTKDGGYRWLLLTCLLVQKHADHCILSVSQVDITERKKAIDRQRISEDMLRIAAENDKRALITYDVKANTCRVESRTLYAGHFGETISDIPNTLIKRQVVAPDSVADLRALFASIRSGVERITVSLQLNMGNGEFQWFECNAATVFDADGKPDHAVLVFHNITEQRVKEAVFKKWQHSIEERPLDSFTLFRCNMSRGAGLDEREGELLKVAFSKEACLFNDRTREYADRYVYTEDHKKYCELLNADGLLSAFYRGSHMHGLEYREVCEDGELRWRKLTVELVEYMNSTDVQAFLLYEDIDRKKREELKEKELAESDPLTGALNRAAFCEKVDAVIAKELSSQHVLLLIEVDGISRVSDAFGHAAGDQALIDATAVIRSFTRAGDRVCRLEGGRFLALLCDLPYNAVVEKKAKQMCELLGRSYSREVQTRANIGIAVYPVDGHDFDALYHNADRALHAVKVAGNDPYAFFSKSIDTAVAQSHEEADKGEAAPSGALWRRMLIVDDNELNRVVLAGWFRKEYLIEMASSGEEALSKLRHFGSAISIVLLDLSMPGMNGYEVLQRMQNNVDLQTIPVIVVSGDDDYGTALKAIECGAADYVTKPVDLKLIRIRVQSAVSRAENERLRAQNSYLQLQRDEEIKFRTVLESTGTVVVEYDWHNKVFVYDNSIHKSLAGDYSGGRPLWTVFLMDAVADGMDVQELQGAVLLLASDPQKTKLNRLLLLKTPAGEKHWFRIGVFKQTDAFGLTDKLLFTFNDVHDEVIADEKLCYQATRDELTGLYNRSGFLQKAAELIAEKEPGYYVLSCVDIENFKVINDQYGAKTGDEVLRGFAATLQSLHSPGKSLCCRVSGDNFAILYPADEAETPELVQQRLAASTAQNSTIPPLKLAIGRCVVDDVTLPVSAIYDRAYLAKTTIKGRYDAFIATYNETMHGSSALAPLPCKQPAAQTNAT